MLSVSIPTDEQKPVFKQCHAGMNIPTDPCKTTTRLQHHEPYATDNSVQNGNISVTNVKSNRGHVVGVGMYPQSYWTRDVAGNEAWCNFTIFVERRTCSSPPTPQNGTLLNQTCGNMYGSLTTYSCPVDQIIVGKRGIQCLATERWEQPEPQCSASACKIHFKAPSFGTFDNERCSAWDGVHVGASCAVRCDKGYQQQGPISAKCIAHQQWSENLEETKCLGRYYSFSIEYFNFY